MDPFPSGLHRFNHDPHETNDMTLFWNDGVPWVRGVQLKTTRKQRGIGVSFLRLEEEFVKEVHSSDRFKDVGCHLTHTDNPPGPNFVMRRTNDFYWPVHRAKVQQPSHQLPRVVGCHYSLAPLVDMTKVALVAEVDRMKMSVCPERLEGAATPSLEPWPPEVLEPSDPLMASVARALRSLSFSETETDVNVRIRAGLEYLSLCAQDNELEELFQNPFQTAFALYAMEAYDPAPSDVYAASDYHATCKKLRDAMEDDDLDEVRRTWISA